MPGYRSLIAGFFQKPLPRRMRIFHGFKGGECLGGDNEQRGLGIYPAQGFGDMRAVDIGYKMHGQIAPAIGREGLGNHGRPEI